MLDTYASSRSARLLLKLRCWPLRMLLATSRRWPFAGQYMVNADANCMATVLAEAFDGGSTNVDMDMLTFSVSPEGPYGFGTTDVTLTVSDGTVMSQCTTSVTVLDVTPPVVTCAEFSQTFSGEDQCADAIVQNNPTGMFSPIGEPNTAGTTYTCTFTATDGCGQTSMCDQVFTVQDTIAPTVMANDTTLYLDDNGMAELSVEDYEYAASDDCAGGVTITDIFRVGPDMFFGGAAGANNTKERRTNNLRFLTVLFCPHQI
jgi:hypothetical protein